MAAAVKGFIGKYSAVRCTRDMHATAKEYEAYIPF